MQAKCSNCGTNSWIDTENRDFDQEQDRCSNCGMIGTLQCQHSIGDDDGCLDCGATAEDIALEETAKENGEFSNEENGL